MGMIFVVDDSTLSRNALSHLLEAAGHKVICLGDSVDAADMIVEAAPDLLLLDVVMPGVSGLELLRDLKSRDAMDRLPVIMVTSKTEAEDVSEALEAGAFDYIRKPFNSIEVVARVRSALRTKEYMERLVYLSERDGLTGILNHRTLLRELDRELASLEGPDATLALIMCDIDHFKRVNDEYGHLAGDDVLAGLGKLLAESLGATGQAGRYGGEEFCVLLRGFDRAMAARWSESFRGVIAKRQWHAEGRDFSVTMSFGVTATEAGRGKSPRELIAEADGRLYAAKSGGRDRVVSSD